MAWRVSMVGVCILYFLFLLCWGEKSIVRWSVVSLDFYPRWRKVMERKWLVCTWKGKVGKENCYWNYSRLIGNGMIMLHSSNVVPQVLLTVKVNPYGCIPRRVVSSSPLSISGYAHF